MNIYVANVTTESGDCYTYLYLNEPTREDVIRRVADWEGEIENLSWYQETTSVDISINKVIE